MSMICASTRALNLRLPSIRFRRAGLNFMTNTSVLSQAWLSKELRPWDDVDGRRLQPPIRSPAMNHARYAEHSSVPVTRYSSQSITASRGVATLATNIVSC